MALKKLGKGTFDWTGVCCKEAAESLCDIGVKMTRCPRTIASWNVMFRHNEKFPHPNSSIANGIKPKAPIFEYFPKFEADCKEFIFNNFDNFGVEMLRDEMVNNLLLKHVDEFKKDVEAGIRTEHSDKYKLLERYLSQPPAYSTVVKWVHSLGFKRDSAKKSYYVDGHEKPEQQEHRAQFINQYLTKIEPHCHRWVQLTVDELQQIKSTLESGCCILNEGYHFQKAGIHMIEFHVDDHEALQDFANQKNLEFEGSISVRAETGKKAIIVFGQDEAIYNQNTTNTMQWVGPGGERPLLPKNNGMGKMISAFQSRDTGWGIKISRQQLIEINKQQEGKHYFDRDAATDIHGTTEKMALTESPFVRTFEFGGSNGYWTGSHTIIQTEDCIDCLQVIFGEKYETVFLFDHSSGHAKKRLNGLDARNMTKGWGGKVMRPTLIEQMDGFVGPFYDANNQQMVRIGEEQSMVYSATDLGPFELSYNEKENKRYDVTEMIPVSKQKATKMRKKELVNVLMETDLGKCLGSQSLLSMRLCDLQQKAKALLIDIEHVETSKIRKGWEGKGKGLLQVLWERGFIDESKLKQYRKRVLDENGDTVPEMSLCHMLEQCHDFLHEKTQLEYVCEQLGVKALITTKYHCEFAGEGIEYSWAFSKSLYCRAPLKLKRGKDNFDRLVATCTSREVMKKEIIRRFSKHARQYMLSYQALGLHSDQVNIDTDQYFSQKKIEKMKAMLKCHRAAIDFDSKFVMSTAVSADFDWNTEFDQRAPEKKRKRKRYNMLETNCNNLSNILLQTCSHLDLT